jgi:hypothetical protein
MTKAEEVARAGLDNLFSSADMDSFRKMMGAAEDAAPVKRGLDPAFYAACFGTPEGQAVLQDLYSRYVHVTRAVPGQGADAAFLREGMAQVVFDIVDQISQAHSGD